MKQVFIVGGTGYMGTRLISALLKRGHVVTALARKGSEKKLPEGTRIIIANPFSSGSFATEIPANAVFVQMLGVAHPSPKKAAQFTTIDLQSVKASLSAARDANVAHFVYVSVAMEPSGMMHAYQETRKTAEASCLQTSIPCTFLRPWYVLGPGHYWPVLLLPLYWIAHLIPSLRKKASAFGLVTITQMIRSLVNAVEAEPVGCRVVEIGEIRRMSDFGISDFC
jgi:nucleoside-diphosphate-sugar epimerase